MFNYHNLNDVEFEALCKDVMERMLSTKLRLFAKGRDGGIDLTDNVSTHNIVVQVKHYIRSTFSNLRTTLRTEIINVEKWKPKKYYLCCGMELTDANVSEVYSMFSEYMESDENIISLTEIDEFLQKKENEDIVRKHYKLWLYASNILSQLYNQNIFVDCEALLGDIEEESKYFVQTEIYNTCIECLDKDRILMLTGHPGVGKTLTSKMLVLYYASQGYAVRYTTNGILSDIKRVLSQDKDAKEIVLLDDCLGQHYFSMKENQESELVALAKYIRMHENKKLLLNSRITILNEARERYESFDMFFKEKKIDKLTINMDNITSLEKAKIFYNHLVSKKVPKVYYENIRGNRNYLKIVMHNNYTPRIIEHVTLGSNYFKITPDKFADYIFEALNNPQDIWKNEYYQRIREEDRIFLTTLYSLTDTTIGYNILKKCFEFRLLQMNNIDYTLNNFEMVLVRLNQSIIKIIDNKGEMYIGVINPSVNDFLKNIFSTNDLEVEKIRSSILYYLQMERCYSKDELPQIIEKKMIDGTILNINFNTKMEKDYFITSNICEKNILNKVYKENIENFFQDTLPWAISIRGVLSFVDVLKILLVEPILSYYDIGKILNKQTIKNLISGIALEDLVSTINVLYEYIYYNKTTIEFSLSFTNICKQVLLENISDYVDNVIVSEYCDNYDIQDLINNNMNHGQYEMEIDEKSVKGTIEGWINDDVYEEISGKLGVLNEGLQIKVDIPTIHIDENEVDDVINSYLEGRYDDYGDDYEGRGGSGESYVNEIEFIFER